MNNLQISQNTMHNAFTTFLNANSSIYSSDTTFQNCVNEYLAKKAELKSTIEYLEADKTPYSKEKAFLKNSLSNLLSDICGFAKVGFIDNQLHIFADQMELSVAKLISMPDSICYEKANTIRNIINDQMSILSPAYVTAADITALDKAILDYTNAKGNSENIHRNSPDMHRQLKIQLAKLADLMEHITLLSKRYRNTQPDFFMELNNASTMGTVNVHHTSLVVEIANANNGSKITNAMVKLDKSKKTATSDSNGIASIVKLKHGLAIVTFTAPGYQVYSKTIRIEQGKENQMQVVLTPAA